MSYRCFVYDINITHASEYLHVFTRYDYYEALAQAKRHTFFLYNTFYRIIINVYVVIYYVPLNSENISIDSTTFSKTVYHPVVDGIVKIQRLWRILLFKRKRARKIISDSIWFALGNPYTQLGRNRLLREFNEL